MHALVDSHGRNQKALPRNGIIRPQKMTPIHRNERCGGDELCASRHIGSGTQPGDLLIETRRVIDDDVHAGEQMNSSLYPNTQFLMY